MDTGGSTNTKEECHHHWLRLPGSDVIAVAQGPTSSTLSTTSSSSCHFCGYESARQSNVVRHIKSMHEMTPNQVFQCCDTTFQDKAEYRAHCRQAHREGHLCRICQRRFTRRALLRRHQSVHTGFKEFSCQVCPYASSHKSNLERHFKTHGIDAPLLVGTKSKIRRKRKNPQPDSTTSTGKPESLGYQYPILRNILKVSASPSSSPTPIKSKPMLSHSIESILGRKEVEGRGEQAPQVPEPRKEVVVGSKTNELLLPGPLPSNVGFRSVINHSLSSPFNWTPSFLRQEALRNQDPPLHHPLFLPPPPSFQDLRIYSMGNSLEVPQIWLNPFFTPQHHLVSNNQNCSYHNYKP